MIAAREGSEYRRLQRERADVRRQYLLASLVGVCLLIVVLA